MSAPTRSSFLGPVGMAGPPSIQAPSREGLYHYGHQRFGLGRPTRTARVESFAILLTDVSQKPDRNSARAATAFQGGGPIILARALSRWRALADIRGDEHDVSRSTWCMPVPRVDGGFVNVFKQAGSDVLIRAEQRDAGADESAGPLGSILDFGAILTTGVRSSVQLRNTILAQNVAGGWPPTALCWAADGDGCRRGTTCSAR